MKKGSFIVVENDPVARGVFMMRLAGDASAFTAPGQFANLALPELSLRRPMSVCRWDGVGFTTVYRVQGRGTEYMSRLSPGAELDILTGLGNGFDISKGGGTPMLIGGGTGAAPLLGLAQRLRSAGSRPTVIIGAASADCLFLLRELSDCARVLIATEDGSLGVKGLVTDAMGGIEHSFLYACGPEPMLRAVAEASPAGGEFSFEARMGCGFGACMGCSRQTKHGYKRICREGPVLDKEEIIW